jgi:tRNA (guanine26-N2/guanine27-N2)-dimethyltransferase
MLRLLERPNLTLKNYGFLGYCHQCGEYIIVPWHQLRKVNCSNCATDSSLILNGALWLGNLHDKLYLSRMKALAQQLNWSKRVELLSLMENEADLPPYFYTLKEMGRRGKINIPPKYLLIQALQKQGYLASGTHINPQAIKTNASLATCIDIGKTLKLKKVANLGQVILQVDRDIVEENQL